jgi:hypothetical protein
MKKLIVICLVWFAAFPAFGYGSYYRVTEEGPNKIFDQGFSPSGTNRNLLDHMDGLSCAVRPATQDVPTSAYIDLNDAQGSNIVMLGRLQMMLAGGIPNPTVWRYEIRPAATDYNVANAFTQRVADGTTFDLQTGRIADLHARAIDQQAWIATERIAPNRIATAQAFMLDRGQVVRVPDMLRINPNQTPGTMERNARVLPLDFLMTGPSNEPSRARYVVAATAMLLSACACGARPRSDTDSRSVGGQANSDAMCNKHVVRVANVPERLAYTLYETQRRPSVIAYPYKPPSLWPW